MALLTSNLNIIRIIFKEKNLHQSSPSSHKIFQGDKLTPILPFFLRLWFYVPWRGFAAGKNSFSLNFVVHRFGGALPDEGSDRDRCWNGQPQRRDRLANQVQLRLRPLLFSRDRTRGKMPQEMIVLFHLNYPFHCSGRCIQGCPSGRRTPFVGNKSEVRPQYKHVILL